MSHVLVTGGSGFLGRNLIPALRRHGMQGCDHVFHLAARTNDWGRAEARRDLGYTAAVSREEGLAAMTEAAATDSPAVQAE